MKAIRLDILFEDKHILVVNKPAGLLTVGTEKEKDNTLYHQVYLYLKKKNQRVFLIHKLDKDASGLVLFAKSEKAKMILQDNMDKVIRKYYAICYGNGMRNTGCIKVRLSETKTLLTYVDDNGKESTTLYHLIKNVGKYNLVEIEPLTSRRNQIRVSMNHIGFPILGDKKYGKAPNPLRRLCLDAYLLEFNHPITHEHKKIEIPYSKIYDNLLK